MYIYILYKPLNIYSVIEPLKMFQKEVRKLKEN